MEGKISLGPIRGRIDHLAVDVTRKLLFIAEFGNDSIGVVDIANTSVRSTLPGFKEPQGISVEPPRSNRPVRYCAPLWPGAGEIRRVLRFSSAARPRDSIILATELAMAPISVLSETAGIDIVGLLPAELQSPDMLFFAAIPWTSRHHAEVRLSLTTGPVKAIYQAKGMQPG